MEHHAPLTFLPALHIPGFTHSQVLVLEYTWLSMLIVILMTVAVAVSLKTVPGPFQNFFEMIVAFLEDYTADIVGPKGLIYFPLIITVFLFVAVSNYMGLIPGCIAPTGDINTTAGVAIVVFIFYQFVGFKHQGIKYLKKFLGPIPVMAPIMVVMELISELARPFSLSLRLFANILGGEMIIKLLSGMLMVGLPVIWMAWESVLTAPIQAFVFSLLTMIYLAGAVTSEEH